MSAVGWSLPGGARRGSRRGIKIAALPELEDEQLPESQRVIAASRKMLVHQPIHEPRVEVPSLPGPSRHKDIREHVCESASKPDAKRNSEPLFPSIEDSIRQQRADRLLQDVLPPAVFDLER